MTGTTLERFDLRADGSVVLLPSPDASGRKEPAVVRERQAARAAGPARGRFHFITSARFAPLARRNVDGAGPRTDLTDPPSTGKLDQVAPEPGREA